MTRERDSRTRLASPEHPPSARVIVDRVRAHHHARARRRPMFRVRAARPGEFAAACLVERRGGFYEIVGPRRAWQEVEVHSHGLAMVVGGLKGWGRWTH